MICLRQFFKDLDFWKRSCTDASERRINDGVLRKNDVTNLEGFKNAHHFLTEIHFSRLAGQLILI
jgi:hypothetical protein